LAQYLFHRVPVSLDATLIEMRPNKENLFYDFWKTVMPTKVVDLFELPVGQASDYNGAWLFAALDDRDIATN